MKWEYLEELDDHIESHDGSIRKRIFRSLQKMIQLRKSHPALGGVEMKLIETGNDHLLGFVRQREGNRLTILANFSEDEQVVEGNRVRALGLGRYFKDIISGLAIETSKPITLEPYQILWLEIE